jgi:hypothetical protein
MLLVNKFKMAALNYYMTSERANIIAVNKTLIIFIVCQLRFSLLLLQQHTCTHKKAFVTRGRFIIVIVAPMPIFPPVILPSIIFQEKLTFCC